MSRMDYAYPCRMTLTIDLQGHDLICPQRSIMFICVHYENQQSKNKTITMFAKFKILVHLHTVTLTLKFKVTFCFSKGEFICQNQLST